MSSPESTDMEDQKETPQLQTIFQQLQEICDKVQQLEHLELQRRESTAMLRGGIE